MGRGVLLLKVFAQEMEGYLNSAADSPSYDVTIGSFSVSSPPSPDVALRRC
jgi:hypothetical protein